MRSSAMRSTWDYKKRSNVIYKHYDKIMAKVYVFLADGFEDVEALIPIDVLRRGGVDVTTVSITDFPLVQSAHGVNIEADMMFEQGDFADADLLFLPGGMPGASNLFEHKGVCKAIVDQHMAGKKVAAICASLLWY